MKTQAAKRAVGYIRMSTDEQQDSPARQRRDIQALAERGGYHIVRWYEDHGQTGTESSKRKDFQKLLADAQGGTFQAVLISEQSRMSREDVFDAMVHWRLLRDAGVKIVTCQRGELDFSNLGGVITAIVDQYGAREESVRLAERVVSGKRLAVSRGQKQGGTPFGFDREILDESGRVVRRVSALEKFRRPMQWSSRLVASSDVKAVESVRLMFELLAGGASAGAVARQLNRQGYRTMFGGRFNGTSIRRMARNPVYIGKIVSGRRRRGKFRSLHDEGGVSCENAHEPLIPPELFDRVQRQLARRTKTHPAPTPGKYLLTGLLFLPDGRRLQGLTMSHSNRKSVRSYYTLPTSSFEEYPELSDRPTFRAEVVEHGVLSKLQAFLADARTQQAIHGELRRRTRKVASHVGRLESQLAAVRSKLTRGTENLALASPADIPGITQLLSTWRDQESQLLQKIRQAQGEPAPTPEAVELLSRLDDLLTHITASDREKLCQALRQTIHRITLRCERRGVGRHRVTLWDGVLELRPDLGVPTLIPLTDSDLPSPGRWREVATFIRQRGDVVYFRDVCAHLGVRGSCVSRLLSIAVSSGQILNLGHQKGWIAVQ